MGALAQELKFETERDVGGLTVKFMKFSRDAQPAKISRERTLGS
jgi:hypothetical protein